MNFYACIIGTELLNGRRDDAHLPFLKEELLQRGWELCGVFMIKDDVSLMKALFSLVHHDPQGVLFSFGGIGATPDDYTRQIAAEVFRDGELYPHPEAVGYIVERFGDDAYPHRIHMGYLPQGATLLQNPVNNVPGFALDQRFFFVPGFPSMAHPMIKEALDHFYPYGQKRHRKTLTAHCGENDLIDFMNRLPASIELSSLPSMLGTQRKTVISLCGDDEQTIEHHFKLFCDALEHHTIAFELGDYQQL